jgi:hypothetical protein
VIGIDIIAAGTVTPPAVIPPVVGTCSSNSADQVVRMPAFAALYEGTGLPVAGPAVAVRMRGTTASAGTTGSTTGAFLDATVRPSVHTTALRESAVLGLPAGHTSSTPGDLPPEDPLS